MHWQHWHWKIDGNCKFSFQASRDEYKWIDATAHIFQVLIVWAICKHGTAATACQVRRIAVKCLLNTYFYRNRVICKICGIRWDSILKIRAFKVIHISEYLTQLPKLCQNAILSLLPRAARPGHRAGYSKAGIQCGQLFAISLPCRFNWRLPFGCIFRNTQSYFFVIQLR